MNRRRNTNAGFTLLELMMVVSVISLLSVIAMPGVSSSRTKSLNTKCIGNQRVIWQSVNRYEFDYNATLAIIKSNGVLLRNTLINSGYVRQASSFECPTSQVKDNDDILLTYSGLDFVNTYCSMNTTTHVLQ